MAISGISVSSNSFQSSPTKSKADETLEQLAADGDPIAIAELKQQEEQPNSVQKTTAQQTGPTEPNKGEQLDRYV